MRADLAEQRARELVSEPWRPTSPDGRTRKRRVAVGDPQAPLPVFLEILERHALLGDDGWILPEVALLSIGDHFDFGGSRERERAAEDGLALLRFLAAHPPDQVTLIAGNHDLGRVGELASFDDETFAEVHARAVAVYRDGDPDREAERALCEEHPSLATAEVAARDFAAFTTSQRELVWALLRARRFRVAHAGGGRLFCHAGVTRDHLSAIGVPGSEQADATRVASALNHALDAAVDAHAGGAFAIPSLHRPGDRAGGEGGGMLYHRPVHPELPLNRGHDVTRLLGRRFDPRRLPLGLTQIIGHVADVKCRELLGPWASDEEPCPGALRNLVTDGDRVAYRSGLPARAASPDSAVLVFIDGLMYRAPTASYALYEW